jgi:hypothetical protein
MGLLERVVVRAGDAATRNIAGMVHAAPRRGSGADLRADHDRWKRSASTGMWFLPDAELAWVQEGWGGPKLVCYGGFNFTRDHGDLFWTADGKRSSWEAWELSHGRGLTQKQPSEPKPLQGLGGSQYAKDILAQGWDKVTLHA